jgi:hypothetical protein
LYALDIALFAAHEIDSAYWQEWKLFGLPGGIGLFVLLHVPLLYAFAWGLTPLTTGKRAGYVLALLLAATGFAALFIHGGFISAGHAEFRTPVSLGVIAVMWVISIALAGFTLRDMRGGSRTLQEG